GEGREAGGSGRGDAAAGAARGCATLAAGAAAVAAIRRGARVMESELRAALIDWLRGDAVLAGLVNAVSEEAPSRASLPWLGIAASASADWSTKDRRGREVRVALELQMRGDDPAAAA